MKKTAALVLAGAALAAFAATAWRLWPRPASSEEPAAQSAPSARGRSIVLVTIDTLRADRLGAYGSSRGLTPTLDQLAREGVTFTAALAQAPLTLPSHATILTGLHPARHGVRTNDGFRLPAGIPTLPEALGASGYATAAFVGGAPLRATSGIGRGFGAFDDGFLRRRRDGPRLDERRADEVIASALGWIEQQRSRPFFVWVHLFDPHTPYEPPPEQAAAYPEAPYDGEVAYTDAALGRLFARLRALDVFDHTLVICVSDHGESLGDHGERTHGTFLYDATVRIPLIIRLPRGGSARRVVDAPVEAADLAPTIAELAGVAWSHPRDGQSLVPLLGGAAGDPERAAYAESYYQNVLLGWSPLRAVRTSRWKFVEAPRPELYDLRADPGELLNRADQQPNLVRAFRSAIGQRAGDLQEVTSGAPSGRDAAALRSLGYASGRTDRPAASLIDPKDRIDVWREIETGIDLLDREPDAAGRALRRALAMDPSNGLALKYQGDLSYRAERDAEAAAFYNRAVLAGFRHPDVFVNLAAIAARHGRHRAARDALERAVATDPQAADAWNQLGILRAAAGERQPAREAFARARQADPERAEPYYNLALIERQQGNAGAVKDLLKLALAKDPAYAEAHVELGNEHLAARQLPEALAEYRAALDSRPDYAEALFGAARVAAILGRGDDARRDYERFVATAPREYRRQIAVARREIARLK